MLLFRKTCKHCQTEKLSDCFNKSSKNSDGLQLYCKTCQKIKKDSWYLENAEAERARSRHFWAAKTDEERRRENHSPERKEYLKGWKISLRSRYGNLVRTCVTRKWESDISYEDYCKIFEESDCHYCGEAIQKTSGAALDRVDSSIGYLKSNVVRCCYWCNIMKNRQSSEDFFNRVKTIFKKKFG